MNKTERRKEVETMIYNAMPHDTLETMMVCAERISEYRKKCKNYDMMEKQLEKEVKYINSILKNVLKQVETIDKFIDSGIMDDLVLKDYKNAFQKLLQNPTLVIKFNDMEGAMLYLGEHFLESYPDATICLERKKLHLKNLEIELLTFNQELKEKTKALEILYRYTCEIKSILKKEAEATKLSIKNGKWLYNGKIMCPILTYNPLNKKEE